MCCQRTSVCEIVVQVHQQENSRLEAWIVSMLEALGEDDDAVWLNGWGNRQEKNFHLQTVLLCLKMFDDYIEDYPGPYA